MEERDEEFEQLKEKIEQKKQEEQSLSVFERREKAEVKEEPPKNDQNNELVEQLFQDGIKYQIQTNTELQDRVLETAKTFVENKAEVIQNNVEAEKKESIYNNNKDACEAYGFNEKRTPHWATMFMKWGYNVVLAIYLFLASFTVMPIIFLFKKISVAVKHTWLAIIFALFVYLFITIAIPLIIKFNT